MKSNNILITGGSGFLGSFLIPHLKAENRSVSVIGRKNIPGIPSYLWNINEHKLDTSAFSGIDSIIHLAGAGIADKRWTKKYKKEILESRVKSSALLFNKLKSTPNNIQTIIAASAVGYYGNNNDVWIEEDFRGPEDFLGDVCSEWEKASLKFESLGIRVVILRIGIVLAENNGALPKLALPVKLFAGAPLGSGEQYISWIHIEDLCRMISFALDDNKIHGVFNAVSPGPVTNKEFTKMVGQVLHRPVWPLNVPSFLLKILLGEKSALVLNSQRVSSEKIRMAGFNFTHPDLLKTLTQFLK